MKVNCHVYMGSKTSLATNDATRCYHYYKGHQLGWIESHAVVSPLQGVQVKE